MMKHTKKAEVESLSCEKNKKTKKIICIVLIVIAVFVFYNLGWIGWRYFKYTAYTEGLEVFIENLSYVYTDEEGYLYNVKLPDYLTYTGNLCVAVPGGESALIIWPKVSGGYEYGVQLELDGETYSIMLNKDFTAQDGQFEHIITTHSDVIYELYNKAVEMWHVTT